MLNGGAQADAAVDLQLGRLATRRRARQLEARGRGVGHEHAGGRIGGAVGDDGHHAQPSTLAGTRNCRPSGRSRYTLFEGANCSGKSVAAPSSTRIVVSLASAPGGMVSVSSPSLLVTVPPLAAEGDRAWLRGRDLRRLVAAGAQGDQHHNHRDDQRDARAAVRRQQDGSLRSAPTVSARSCNNTDPCPRAIAAFSRVLKARVSREVTRRAGIDLPGRCAGNTIRRQPRESGEARGGCHVYIGPLGEALGIAIGWALGKLYEWITRLLREDRAGVGGAVRHDRAAVSVRPRSDRCVRRAHGQGARRGGNSLVDVQVRSDGGGGFIPIFGHGCAEYTGTAAIAP